MKHTKSNPQFDLPLIATEAFNLIFEQSADGERLRREMESAEQTLREANEIEKKQQPSLI